jgi:tRNA(fMet)-specific endonuclease VapC
MDGLLLDTNAASILWDQRHREYDRLRVFFRKVANAPAWISVVVLGEIEYGIKTAPYMNKERRDAVRQRMGKFPLVLNIDKHTIEHYSDLRAALFKSYSPKNGLNRLKQKRPENLQERTRAKELGIQENDLWIAAQAIQYNLLLVTNDRMKRLQEVSAGLKYPLQLASWKES